MPTWQAPAFVELGRRQCVSHITTEPSSRKSKVKEAVTGGAVEQTIYDIIGRRQGLLERPFVQGEFPTCPKMFTLRSVTVRPVRRMISPHVRSFKAYQASRTFKQESISHFK